MAGYTVAINGRTVAEIVDTVDTIRTVFERHLYRVPGAWYRVVGKRAAVAYGVPVGPYGIRCDTLSVRCVTPPVVPGNGTL